MTYDTSYPTNLQHHTWHMTSQMWEVKILTYVIWHRNISHLPYILHSNLYTSYYLLLAIIDRGNYCFGLLTLSVLVHSHTRCLMLLVHSLKQCFIIGVKWYGLLRGLAWYHRPAPGMLQPAPYRALYHRPWYWSLYIAPTYKRLYRPRYPGAAPDPGAALRIR